MTSLISNKYEKDPTGLWNAMSIIAEIQIKHAVSTLLQKSCYIYSVALWLLGMPNIFSSFARVGRTAKKILDQSGDASPEGNFSQRFLAYCQLEKRCTTSENLRWVETQIANFLFLGKYIVSAF